MTEESEGAMTTGTTATVLFFGGIIIMTVGFLMHMYDFSKSGRRLRESQENNRHAAAVHDKTKPPHRGLTLRSVDYSMGAFFVMYGTLPDRQAVPSDIGIQRPDGSAEAKLVNHGWRIDNKETGFSLHCRASIREMHAMLAADDWREQVRKCHKEQETK